MNDSTVKVYAAIADKKERDPYGPDGGGRATVVNGRGFQKYRRFNPNEELIWVETPEGKDAWLTRKQADLYLLALTFVDKGTITIRFLARELKCSPSTISRGMVKLASLGLLAALVGRGRYAGVLIFRLPRNGSLNRIREAAKLKIRLWSKQANARLLRTKSIVASYHSWREIEDHGLENYFTTSMVATMKQPWTPDDLRDAGII